MNITILILCFWGAVMALHSTQHTAMNHSSGGDRLFVSATLVFLILGAIALASVRLEVFSVQLVSMLTLALSVTTYVVSRMLESKTDKSSEPDCVSELPVVGVLGVLCVLLYAWFPTYYLLGGRDHGLYLIFAHHISQTGGLVLDLPWLTDIDERVGEAIQLGYPGIYSAYERGLSGNPSELIPQFMHLFPAFGALSHQAAGLEGVVRTNAVIALFALWSFFMVARRIVGDMWGLAATTLLAINASMIWVTRSTFTEPLQILILFAGIHFLFKAADRVSVLWALVAGVVLGLGIFNRLAALLVVFAIVGFALYACIYRPKLRQVAFCLTGSYLGGSTLGLIDGYLHTYPYLFDLWVHGSLAELVIANYVLGFGTVILLFIRDEDALRRNAAAFLYKILPWVLIGLVAWVVIRYGLSFSADADFPLRSVRELGWYVTPLALVLAIVGVWVLNKEGQWLYILTVGGLLLGTLFIYTWKPFVSPDHYWASRRWLSFCIPLIVLFSTKAIQYAYRNLIYRGYSFTLSSLIVIVPMTWYLSTTVVMAAPFWSTSLLASYPKNYNGLVKELVNNESVKFYATTNTQLAAILTYVYDVPTVLASAKDFRIIQNEFGGQVWVIGSRETLISSEKIRLPKGEFRWCGEYTERVQGTRSAKLMLICHHIEVKKLDPEEIPP